MYPQQYNRGILLYRTMKEVLINFLEIHVSSFQIISHGNRLLPIIYGIYGKIRIGMCKSTILFQSVQGQNVFLYDVVMYLVLFYFASTFC